MTDPYQTLHAIGLRDQLEAMERIAAKGQQGKYAGKSILEKTADYHFTKADSHQCRAGSHYQERDEETGEPHLDHAALRLLMASHCAQNGKVTDDE